jgi:hypothetical protein
MRTATVSGTIATSSIPPSSCATRSRRESSPTANNDPSGRSADLHPAPTGPVDTVEAILK